MLPFFQPGEDIWFKPVSADTIRPGDVVTYRKKPHILVTHRVIKIVKDGDTINFITKGDNRFAWDPIVADHQIIGKVIRIGKRNLNRSRWRWIGRLIASVSYLQGSFYTFLINSRLNQFRHHLEKKRLIPEIRPFAIFRMASSPLFWITDFKNRLARQQCRRLIASQGISIKIWTPEDVKAMLEIWNSIFPNHSTSLEHFSKMICNGPWFNPAGCFLMRDKMGRLLGWAFASLHDQNEKYQKGFIEVFALTDAAIQSRATEILTHESLGWFRKNKVREVYIGPQWVFGNSLIGLPRTPLFTALTNAGFYPRILSAELSLKRTDYQPLPKTAEDLTFDGNPDAAKLNQFFERNEPLEPVSQNRKKEGILTAIHKNQIVAYCRFLKSAQIKDYSDLSWIWAAGDKRETGYFFHLLVDKDRRKQNFGTQLAMRAFELLFEAGCNEIVLSINQNGFYEDFYTRFGFRKKGRHVSWKRI